MVVFLFYTIGLRTAFTALLQQFLYSQQRIAILNFPLERPMISHVYPSMTLLIGCVVNGIVLNYYIFI